ncbi:MAG: diguanylate cyclase, partial [Alistipes sp.]|nr:diguanylate cyclase [Alistipes sp.]
SLGIGSCFVSRAEDTFRTDLGRELQRRAGIEEYYLARVHLCLGYPEGEAMAKPRREVRIHIIK